MSIPNNLRFTPLRIAGGLVIVGALHLVGQDGLVYLLQQAGYQVVQR